MRLLTTSISASYRQSPTDLSAVLGLTQGQLDTMKGDSRTVLPAHLKHPSHWPELKVDGEEEEKKILFTETQVQSEVLEEQTPFNETFHLNDDDNFIHSQVMPFDAPKLLENALYSLEDLATRWKRDQRFSLEAQDLSRALAVGQNNALIIHDAAQRLTRDLERRVGDGDIPDDADVQNSKLTLLAATADMGQADDTVRAALEARENMRAEQVAQADLAAAAATVEEVFETLTEPEVLRPLLKENFATLRDLAIKLKAHIDTETWLITQQAYAFAARMSRIVRVFLSNIETWGKKNAGILAISGPIISVVIPLLQTLLG